MASSQPLVRYPDPTPSVARLIAVLLIAFGALASPGLAQELTPRAYWPAPKGTRVGTLGAVYTAGDVVPDPSLPITGVNSAIATFVVGYLQSIDLFGRSANVVFEAPFSTGNTSADVPDLGVLERDYQGLGDVAATVSINLLGAPTMNREEFAALRRDPRPILGASLRIVAPTGRYDSDRLVNVGANRWAARGELGYMAKISPKLLLELKAGAWFFGDNDNFLGVTRQQDPIYSFQMNLIRRFSPGFWASLDANVYRGGRGRIGPTLQDNLQRDGRLGASIVFPFRKRNAVRISAAAGALDESDESFTLITVALQHVF